MRWFRPLSVGTSRRLHVVIINRKREKEEERALGYLPAKFVFSRTYTIIYTNDS